MAPAAHADREENIFKTILHQNWIQEVQIHCGDEN